MATALIAGSTGLVGSCLLQLLLKNDAFKHITILVRNPIDLTHPKLTVLPIDFEKLGEVLIDVNPDIVFSCLGTTKAKTPDKSLYFKIEHDYPVQLATLTQAKGASQFHYISSMGANATSLNLYSKNKGLAEMSLRSIGFESMNIYRPSLLLGARNELRPLEKVSAVFLKILKPLMVGKLKKYKAIAANDVATAMMLSALTPLKGYNVIESDLIKDIADRKMK